MISFLLIAIPFIYVSAYTCKSQSIICPVHIKFLACLFSSISYTFTQGFLTPQMVTSCLEDGQAGTTLWCLLCFSIRLRKAVMHCGQKGTANPEGSQTGYAPNNSAETVFPAGGKLLRSQMWPPNCQNPIWLFLGTLGNTFLFSSMITKSLLPIW